MPPKKATTRAVIAAPPPEQTREEREIAALVADREKAEAAPSLSRIQALLSPEALDALDTMQYMLKRGGFRTSASALIETAILELKTSSHETTELARKVRERIGEHAARRRPAP